MIVLFTRKNPASSNIADRLLETGEFRKTGEKSWSFGEHELIDCGAPSVLEVPTDFNTDAIIVLSTHKSRKGGEMLTVHAPGNWGEAKMGGKSRTLNTAAPSLMKTLIKNINKNNTLNWPVSLEADHHGPTSKVPMVFVEIGSTEAEWGNRQAGKIIADSVLEALTKVEIAPAVFGVGGGHYSREFTSIDLETEFAVGHIAPKYVLDNLDYEMFRQAVEKNTQDIEKVLIARKATNSGQKKKITEFAGKYGVSYEFI